MIFNWTLDLWELMFIKIILTSIGPKIIVKFLRCLTLFLLVMGWINQCTVITWHRLLDIGLQPCVVGKHYHLELWDSLYYELVKQPVLHVVFWKQKRADMHSSLLCKAKNWLNPTFCNKPMSSKSKCRLNGHNPHLFRFFDIWKETNLFTNNCS